MPVSHSLTGVETGTAQAQNAGGNNLIALRTVVLNAIFSGKLHVIQAQLTTFLHGWDS